MSAESPLRDRLGAADRLIETFRWEPETGVMRWPQHRARLLGSARAFGWPEPQSLEGHLARIEGQQPLRVRLTLDENGSVEVATQPFRPPPGDTVWRVAIARARLDSGDPLLRHKTTRRTVYETARAAFPTSEVDEVLLLNERDELCEGTITSLFIDDGWDRLRTPPLTCGLLPGILRGELLSEGRASEGIIRKSDLSAAPRIFVGNALRGMIPARLVG